jgi:branched-chain amino acid transport system substrate-binding protein
MKLLTRIFLLVCMLGALAISAFGQDIIIGGVASLTGSEATFDVNSSNGIELAKQEINNAGGLLGGGFGVALSG